MRLCIIADDLTGALDAAAPFAGRGLSVRVALSPSRTAAAVASGAGVIAVSTRSRDGTEAAAATAMRKVLAALPPGTRLLKKINSRLKGHVAAEIAALDPQHMLVAPAIPDFGRVTRDGLVIGFGVDRPIAIRDRLGALADRASIPDVETPDQMRAALAGAAPDTLLVGARGLTEALAIAMTGQAAPVPVRPRARRALMVVGSQDPITLAQVERVRAGLRHAPAPLGDLADPGNLADADQLLVQATPGNTPGDGPDTAPRAPEDVARALARSVHPRLTAGRQAILLSGGATAEAVLSDMDAGVLDLRGECLPGLAVAHAAGTCVIAKSGGFGDENTLASILAMFRDEL